jgi:hypothetical protein
MARRKQGGTKQTRSRSEAGNRNDARRYESSVSQRGLPLALLIIALTLLASHAALWLYHFQVAPLHGLWLQLLDVDQESNLPTWFSQLLLLIASALLWICARRNRSEGAPFTGNWYVLSVGFLLMSVDEVAGVHESINSVIVVSWAIPAAFGTLVVGLAFVPFLLHLPRLIALLFAAAGALYLTGALAAEIMGNSMVEARLENTLGYKMTTMGEESLEMTGLILFVYALLRYMRGLGKPSARTPIEVE